LGEYLLADSAYELTSTVQTPFKGQQGKSGEKKTYNLYLSRARVKIEHCFGLLKNRFMY